MDKKLISLSILAVVTSLMVGMTQAVGLTKEERLGELLYSDTNLSINGNQSCESCHGLKRVKLAGNTKLPAPGFVDPDNVTTRSVVSDGSIPGKFGGLNAPSAGYAAFSPDFFFDETEELWIGGQFWNGRAATLEEQAKGPFLNPVEMAMPSQWAIISVIKESGSYVSLFKEAFGFDLDTVPSNPMASAGEVAPDSVGEAYDLMANAIASFERTVIFNKFDSKFDAVEAGTDSYSAQELEGKMLFEGQAQCVLCHVLDPAIGPDGNEYPPVFTDFSYDNIGVPRTTSIPGNPSPDIGLGATTGDAGDNGKHKVMSLRNIEITAPYGHNGYFRTLEHIVHFYNTRDVAGKGWAPPEVTENVNDAELGNLGLTHEQELAVVAFLKTLTDGYKK